MDYIQKHFNAGAPVVYTERRIGLGALLDEQGAPEVDVLKVDTDGWDVRVLKSAKVQFTYSPPLLAVVECNFNGVDIEQSSTLFGVDAVLRPLGMTLVDLSVWRYSRQQLPSRFFYGIPAQTVTGPVGFGDAVYVDDPLNATGKLDGWLQAGRLQRCLKLVVLYEMIGLADCSAELICALRDNPLSAGVLDWTSLLNALVPPNPWGAVTHAQFIAAFEASPTDLFPGNPRNAGV
jgi:hypothetical protein